MSSLPAVNPVCVAQHVAPMESIGSSYVTHRLEQSPYELPNLLPIPQPLHHYWTYYYVPDDIHICVLQKE